MAALELVCFLAQLSVGEGLEGIFQRINGVGKDIESFKRFAIACAKNPLKK